MTVNELRTKLEKMNGDDLIVITVREEDGEITVWDFAAVGRDGWDEVCELQMTNLISG